MRLQRRRRFRLARPFETITITPILSHRQSRRRGSSFYTKSSVTAASPPKSPVKSPEAFLSPTRERKKKQLKFGEDLSSSPSREEEKSDDLEPPDS